ncbi:MAG TPA: divergent polysaccharide deacetylase family protein [Acetobacteraceae bacterium]|nr:divergent polysaccharide deacetylase family protein [Acetobacteraceae bacterium]
MPEAALLELVAGEPPRFLPRIAPDGRAPMAVYAGGFASSIQMPRVGLVLAGIGLDHAGSEAAAKALPAGVTLAVSPYASNLDPLLAEIRRAGHEYLLSIPMEPPGFPLNNPGDRALMAALPLEENAQRLDWVLSRTSGYVGVTGALGRLRGERFAADAEQMGPVLRSIAGRGLLYVDPRPDAAKLPSVWSRHVDLVLDDLGSASAIDAQLAELSRMAREHGSALGLAGTVRPVTVERIAAWTRQLAAQGIALAPVSALVEAPR